MITIILSVTAAIIALVAGAVYWFFTHENSQ
jgi:hypothetical protein